MFPPSEPRRIDPCRDSRDVGCRAALVAQLAGAATAFAVINVEIMPPARYTYTMVAAGNTFTCTATSGILDTDATVDTWTINEGGLLVPTSDDANS